MFKAFANCWKIPELRQRLLIALGLLFVARMGACIPLPGIDPEVLETVMNKMTAEQSGGIVAMYNLFTGGALLKGAIFALGIMPYISASIIMQLMGAVVPSISRLQQEGDIGRQKIAQYSRYLTVAIAIVQAFMLANAISNPNSVGSVLGFNSQEPIELVVVNKYLFVFLATVLLTAGAIIMTWLGEQMTQRGVGNGTSILITVGILADLPGATRQFLSAFGSKEVGANVQSYTWEHAVGTVVLGIVVYAAMTAVAQTIRKIPIQYAKRVVGRKMFGGQKNSYLPLKLNFAGVMPVIFASAILSFPSMMFLWAAGLSPSLGFLADLSHDFQRGDNPIYYAVDATLIFVFSYFWVSLMFKPIQIADDLKKNNGYIPGIRPGENTAKFLDFVMTRLTLAGSIFLVIIAILPDILAFKLGFAQRLAYLMGGTGGLIAVGVSLDTMAQIEAILLQRHYEGFLKKGRIGGLNIPLPTRKVTSYSEQKGLGKLGIVCATVLILGLAAAVHNFITAADTPKGAATATAPATATTPATPAAPAAAPEAPAVPATKDAPATPAAPAAKDAPAAPVAKDAAPAPAPATSPAPSTTPAAATPAAPAAAK